MEESNKILVDYYDWTNEPGRSGTFSYGDTVVISLPNPEYYRFYQTKTTHTLPNGDVISFG